MLNLEIIETRTKHVLSVRTKTLVIYFNRFVVYVLPNKPVWMKISIGQIRSRSQAISGFSNVQKLRLDERFQIIETKILTSTVNCRVFS